jgi:hypothetical protein
MTKYFQNMDARGWVTEFRCMESNIALKQKINRDLGQRDGVEGSHKRRNLKEIVLFETLVEEAGWLTNPRVARDTFVTLDGKEELSANLIEFWGLCGCNRDEGIKALSKHEIVTFRDVCVLKKDSDEKQLELGAMIKRLTEMIKDIPDENPVKGYITNHFSTDIWSSKRISVVSNFYENVRAIIRYESEEREVLEDDEPEDNLNQNEDEMNLL